MPVYEADDLAARVAIAAEIGPDEYAKPGESRVRCPECGSIDGCVADGLLCRWEQDAIVLANGWTEGRCPNCGSKVVQ